MFRTVKIIFTVTICFSLMVLANSFSCAVAYAADEHTNRDEVLFALEKAIASEYYNFKSKRVIRVYLNDFTNTLPDEGLLKDYFYEGALASLEKGNQFLIGDFSDVGVDCLVNMSFNKLGDKFVKIDAEVTDAQSGRAVANISKTYTLTSFDQQALADFSIKRELTMKESNAIGKTRLVIFVETSGKSIDEYKVRTSTYKSQSNTTANLGTRYEDSDAYSADINSDYNRKSDYTGTYEYKEKIGKNAIYPADIVVYVNNTPYTPATDGIAFDQVVPPGTYSINVKFRKASWDAANRIQLKGRSFSKQFKLDLKKDDYKNFEIFIKMNGNNPDVATRVSDLR